MPLSLLWDTRTKSVYLRWNGFFSLGREEGKVFARIFGFPIPFPLRRSQRRKRFRGSLGWTDLKRGLSFLGKWRLKKVEGTFSFPDPMVNGLLYGWMTALGSWRDDRRVNLTINFDGENRFSGEAELSLKALSTELRGWMGRKIRERR